MIDVHFVILGAVIGSIGTSLYLRDMRRGLTRPDRMTWFLWALAPLLAFAVEVHEGVGLRSLMTFVVGFFPLLVFCASFFTPGGGWRLGPLDWACGVVSLVGIAVWLATRHGTFALAASIVADALAAVPTVRKSWTAPGSETAGIYLGGAVNASLTLLTITHWTSTEAAFPIYILSLTLLEILLVVGRVGPKVEGNRRRTQSWRWQP